MIATEHGLPARKSPLYPAAICAKRGNATGESRKMYPVEIKKLRSRTLIGLTHQGDYQRISNTYATVFDTLDARGLTDQTRQMVAIFHDDPATTDAASLRAFAGVTAPKSLPCDPPLQTVTLPTGRYAVLRFTGDYAGLPAAYAYLYGDWLAQSGQSISAEPSFEVYLNSPRNIPPAEWLTEICLPLTKG
jgi:AraC family transcriptional regulator